MKRRPSARDPERASAVRSRDAKRNPCPLPRSEPQGRRRNPRPAAGSRAMAFSSTREKHPARGLAEHRPSVFAERDGEWPSRPEKDEVDMPSVENASIARTQSDGLVEVRKDVGQEEGRAAPINEDRMLRGVADKKTAPVVFVQQVARFGGERGQRAFRIRGEVG